MTARVRTRSQRGWPAVGTSCMQNRNVEDSVKRSELSWAQGTAVKASTMRVVRDGNHDTKGDLQRGVLLSLLPKGWDSTHIPPFWFVRHWSLSTC